MNYKFLLAFLLLCGAIGYRMHAQGTMACQPGVSWTINCQSSCINCDLNGLTGQNFTLFGGGLQFCQGDLVTNNARWYGFIAGTPNLILGVKPTNCQTGDGLEVAIFDDCPNPNGLGNNEIVCLPGPNPPAGFGYILIHVPPLIVGHHYLLMIDGFNGDVCDYQIDVLQGSTIPPPLGTVGPMSGPTQVCPNATVTYSVPPVQNAVQYTWIGPPGSSINNGTSILVTDASPANTSVEVTFGSAGGSVCFSASNACNPPTNLCLPVVNSALPPTQLPDLIVCNTELPYLWQEEPFNFLAVPGTYNLTSSPYTSYLGCDSIVKQKLTVLPPLYTNIGTKYICKDECYRINGIDYCQPGSYQEVIPTDSGCDSLVSFILVRIPSDAVAAQPDTITCAVTSVPLSGAGSTTGNSVSYKWLDPTGQQISIALSATATMPGQHLFIVTNLVAGIACMDTAFVNVPGNLTPPQANAGPNKVLTCLTSQVLLQGSGSTGTNFSYFWKSSIGGNIVSGATTLTPIVNAPGTYTLRVTNNLNGCTAVSTVVVTSQLMPPNVTALGGISTCAAPNVTLQVSTDALNPSFAWSGPGGFISSLQNPSVSAPGPYVVVVTNGVTMCTASATATVDSGADIPDASATGGAITCAQSSVTLGGNSAFPGVTYQWTGPGGFVSPLQNPTVNVVGNYQLAVTAPNGCTNTASAAVTLNNTVPGTTLATSGNLNCNNATVNVLATSTGNPADLTHDWTLPGGATLNTGQVAFLAAALPGNYSVLVSNATNGCTSTANVTVVQFPNVTAVIDKAEDTKCFNTSDGSLSVLPSGGNGSFSFSWSNGPTTSLNPDLGPGTYIVTVTDSDGCTATISGTVAAPTPVSANASATDQMNNGAADGTATSNPSGGIPGYTYSWSTTATTPSITGLLPGSYTVTVTDANGCTVVQTVNVSQFNCLLQTQLSTTNVSCFGAANGTASVTTQGGTNPVTIAWSTSETSSSISGLSGGSYAVTITDAASCQEVQTFSVTEPNVLAANASSTNTTGPGLNDGTASANPTGGTGTYTYVWSNTETSSSINALAPGFYTVTVTDSNGCTSVQTVEVTGGSCLLSTDFQLSNPTCNGLSNGTATVLLTGGSGSFTYSWSSGGAAATETGLGAGTYTVTATDAIGCSITSTTTLTAPTALTLAVENNQSTSCANLAEGAATVSASGGTGNLAVSWSDGQIGLTAIGLTAGTYTAVVTDANACSASLELQILTDDNVAPVITANDTEMPIGPNGTVLLTTTNMGADVTDNCNLASVSFQPAEFSCTQLGVHVVTITATDDAGNSSTETVTVTVVDDAPPTLICSPSLVNCNEDNPVSYQAPTATDNCLINGGVFNITAGLPIGAVFPLGSTTTTYTFTDAQGNMGSCSFEVTILSPLLIEVDTVYNDINMQNIGAIFINPSGSLPPYTYVWTSNGQQVSTQQNLTGIGAGDYSVVVTDDNGCTVASQTITVSNSSGTQTPNILDEIRIFPNPTAGNLSVLFPDDLVGQNVFFQVFDQTGRRVLEQHAQQEKQVNLNLLNLSDGLYSVVVRIGSNQIVRNIVLNK